jgi:hypothetical protein
MLTYHTGLMAADYYRFPRPPYVGNGWILNLVRLPEELTISRERVGRRIYRAKEVVVRSSDQAKAQRAADLLHAARLLLEGSSCLSHLGPGEHAPIYESTKTVNTYSKIEFVKHAYVCTRNIPLACLIAARASFRLQTIYALAKLRLSLDICSAPFVELDPHHSENIPKSPYPEDHVLLAFAVVTAWSCIEELGFDIRASENNPSKLPDGSWNPKVKLDLEERLRKGHVNLRESFHWNLRGPRTRIEKKKSPILVARAPWARYQVRDGAMEVIDAIHYISFLRSWVAAHRGDKDLVRVLSIYDVANAQFLARRLLLEKLRFWRYWGTHG